MHSSLTSSGRRPRRRVPALALGALALALCAGTLVAPAQAAPASAPASTEVKPAKLKRGADSSVAHFDGSTLVVGSERIPTKLQGHRTVLGTEADGDHLVSAERSRRTTVARVTPDGEVSVVARIHRPAQVIASSDLNRVVFTTAYRARTVLSVRTVDTGIGILQRSFPGHLQTLAAGPHRVLVSQTHKNRTSTWWWNPTTNRTQHVSNWRGYRADLASDRLALLEGDPYQDACQRVVRLSAPRKTLWRSCADRVDAFGPTGMMATVHILSDGLGPNHVALRRVGGRAVARFHTSGWFGDMVFEGPRALVTYAAGRSQAARIRCLPRGCERISDLEPKPQF